MKRNKSTIRNIQFFLACLFFASLNFEMFTPVVEDFSVTKMVAIVYMAGLFLSPRSMFSVKNIESAVYPILMMFFIMVMSSILYLNQNTTIFDTTIFLNILIFILLLNHQRKDGRVFHQGFLWFSISCCIMGVLFYQGIGLTFDSIGRVRIFGDNSNDTGVKMAVGILFLLNYCLDHPAIQIEGNRKEQKIYKPWLLLMTVPMFLLLLATASRVALIVLAMGSIIFVFLRHTGSSTKKFLSLTAGIVALIIGYDIISQQDVVVTRMNDTIEDGNISGRDEIWNAYLPLIGKHPLLGTGFTGHYEYSSSFFGQAMSPHNVLIEVALYSGIIGLFFFIVFLYTVFTNAYKYQKFKDNIGPIITSMAILGMVLSGQALGVKLFWSLAAYALSYKFEYNNCQII